MIEPYAVTSGPMNNWNAEQKIDLDKIGRMNEKWDELPEEQKQALESLTEQENPLSEEELETLIKQLEEAMKSDELVKQLAEANQAGTLLQNQLSQNGMPSSQLAFTNNKGAQGNKAANQPLGQHFSFSKRAA
ncbi:hypothetical protein ACFWMS_03610 [Peribacillus butanolivorans]|uniref:hypothetical protein n=1 Tax=Peribacillus butanolivorans TaxID=421767 RepID=UPI0036570B67